MKKLLFVCSQNKLRSLTAEQIFSDNDNLEVRSAGVDSGARIKLSSEDITWADYIFVMEKRHRDRVQEIFGDYLRDKKIYVLDIPDRYRFMDEELVVLLRKKVAQCLLL